MILIDASPLISFLKLGRFDLLRVLDQPLACTDLVRAGVKRPREQLETLLVEGEIEEIPLVDPAHLLEVEQLYEKGFGRGEGSSIILAAQHHYGLILDDQDARKASSARGIRLYSTTEIIVQNINAGAITCSEADDLITIWRTFGNVAEARTDCKF